MFQLCLIEAISNTELITWIECLTEYILDSAKKSTTDAIKSASKRAIQKTAEATGDLIGNKIADKITSVLKKSPTELYSAELRSKGLQNDEMEAPKKRYISPEERQQIIDELKLIPKKNIFLKIINELRLALKERRISSEERQQINDYVRLL